MGHDARLVLQEPLLATQPAAVTPERAPRADDAVAGDDEPDRIPAVRVAHRAAGARAPHAAGELPIAHLPAEPQRPERRPDDLLKFGPPERHRQVEVRALSL